MVDSGDIFLCKTNFVLVPVPLLERERLHADQLLLRSLKAPQRTPGTSLQPLTWHECRPYMHKTIGGVIWTVTPDITAQKRCHHILLV